MDDEADVVSSVYVFRDRESMDTRMEGPGPASSSSRRPWGSTGGPAKEILEAMQQATGAGVELVIRPEALGGSIRLS